MCSKHSIWNWLYLILLFINLRFGILFSENANFRKVIENFCWLGFRFYLNFFIKLNQKCLIILGKYFVLRWNYIFRSECTKKSVILALNYIEYRAFVFAMVVEWFCSKIMLGTLVYFLELNVFSFKADIFQERSILFH